MGFVILLNRENDLRKQASEAYMQYDSFYKV